MGRSLGFPTAAAAVVVVGAVAVGASRRLLQGRSVSE